MEENTHDQLPDAHEAEMQRPSDNAQALANHLIQNVQGAGDIDSVALAWQIDLYYGNRQRQ